MSAPSPEGALRRLGRFLEIQNLGLNLPFAVAFLIAASGGWPTVRDTVLILVAFVAARNAGHSFNRWADRDVDARNPRTQGRLLVTRPGAARLALAFAAANAILLVVCAALLSPLALALVPVAVLLVLGYSYTKRFTAATTVFLGLVEAVTPAGVYAGVQDALPLAAWIAIAAILLWGTAFEIIHSLGDLRSDTELGLRSLPRSLGSRASLGLLAACHATALALFALFGEVAGLRPGYYAGIVALAGLVVVTDRWVFRAPSEAKRPFRMHFVMAAVFLLAVILGFAGPVG